MKHGDFFSISLLLCAAALTAALFAGCSLLTPPQATPAPTETPSAETVGFLEIATPAPTAMPTPIPTDTPVPTPAPEWFSVVWLTDTQFINSLYPDTLLRMMQWAADNAAANNTKLVVHTGDIVNDFESRRQWETAGTAFSALVDRVPFLAVCGNHDVGTETVTYTRFKKYVAALYPDQSILFDGGRGAYALVDTDEVRLLFVGTGWGYNDASVAYLNGVLDKYPDRVAVLCVHSYLDENGARTDGGDILFDKVVTKHANVKLVLCGHREGVVRLETPIDDNGDGAPDRTVVQLLYNYQSERSNDGGGFLRILTFTPSAHRLDIQTYSPLLNEYLTDDTAQFTIENAY